MGRLDVFDAQRGLAHVSFQGASMVVETRQLATDSLQLRIGSMFQFLGETYRTSNVRWLPEPSVFITSVLGLTSLLLRRTGGRRYGWSRAWPATSTG
jgi:hypothetical protein